MVRRNPGRDPDVLVLRHREAAHQASRGAAKGAIEGVAGPEAANNASAAGTMVPLLSLGLPQTPPRGDARRAGLLRAPAGPLLLQRQSDLVWGADASLLIGNTLLLLLNLPLAPVWAQLLPTPRPYLYAGILFFASMGRTRSTARRST